MCNFDSICLLFLFKRCFPSIGPIPASAYTVDIRLDGRVEEGEVKISVDFRWADQTLSIGAPG